MYIKEITKKQWKVSKNLIKTNWHTKSIASEEQECNLVIAKEFEIGGDNGIIVDCSFQSYITKLSKCEYFELQEVLYNDEGYVLEVKGKMDCKGLTIRKKKIPKKEISEEQRVILSERMKKNMRKGK